MYRRSLLCACVMYAHACTCVHMCVDTSVYIPYTQNNWRVKYLANRSKIVVGVTLIWRKAVAVSKCNSYRPKRRYLNLAD